MLDLMHALQPDDELRGLMLSDEELGELRLEQLEADAGAAVLAVMLPAEQEQEQDEQQLDSLWRAALSPHELERDAPDADDDLVSGELSDSGPDEVMTMMLQPAAATHADALFPSSAVAPLPPLGLRGALGPPPGPEKKRRGRKPSAKSKDTKPKRPPPSEAKARLRSYERRSRHKREVSEWPGAPDRPVPVSRRLDGRGAALT
ncbi:unnamed protein product [Phytophthora fragariaefolia]|uniref:Unnamed protein product n=1 Tax=Phytophthora fragariaefolia TaxID=1490495 RepID=A0A9W7CUH8_9STRA|nr:unnamed protein product [Phytophthora fragariaefolia]